MRNRLGARRKGSYGIDAPYLLPILGALIVTNVVLGLNSRSSWPFVGAAVIVVCACCGLHISRRGKFIAWAELLDDLMLRGDERILDLGCGRGAVLLLAAQYLTTGRAVGVDLWRSRDQSGNAVEATQRNVFARWLPVAEMRAAIDVQDIAGHRRCLGQVHDGIRDVFNSGNVTHRRQAFHKISWRTIV